ncbi:hypothetical protein BLA29_009299, partial [Euroglyphus maynei]
MFIMRRSQQQKQLKVPSFWLFIIGFCLIILMDYTNAKPNKSKKSRPKTKFVEVDTAKYLPLIKEHASPNTLAAIAEAEVQESAKQYMYKKPVKYKIPIKYKKPKYHKMYPESHEAIPHSLKQIAGHYST